MIVLQNILAFLKLSEKLKTVTRHSWLSNPMRQESVPEHTWQMALMAILVAPHLQQPINLERTLKIILLHDLPEAITGDTPWFDKKISKEEKFKLEKDALNKIIAPLDPIFAQEIMELWLEFEDCQTLEAKFAKALDHLEVQFQHTLTDIKTWTDIEYGMTYYKMNNACAHDPILEDLKNLIIQETEDYWARHGIDSMPIRKKFS